MKKIKLNTGNFTLVDDEDYDYLNQWKWFERKAKYTSYAFRRTTLYGRYGRDTSIQMHRLIMGLVHDDGKEIDHINHNGLDNQKRSLRVCTRSENMHNCKHSKGYSWHRIKNKWIARIRINGKLIHLGYFVKEGDARKAYLKAKMSVCPYFQR